jgi:hypothetical protein
MRLVVRLMIFYSVSPEYFRYTLVVKESDDGDDDNNNNDNNN